MKELNEEYKQKRLRQRSTARKKRRKENPAVFMLQSAKKRAKAKGIEFTITLEDIVIPKKCPILGIPIYVGEGFIRYHSPSLDRVDNKKGYIKGNVAVISYKANGFKGDMSITDVRKLLKYMENGTTK